VIFPGVAVYPMTDYYFDTSAFSDLWRSNSTLDQSYKERVLSHLQDHSNSIVLSSTFLDELVPPLQAAGRVDQLRERLAFLEKCSLKAYSYSESLIRVPLSRVDIMEAFHSALYRPEIYRTQGSRLSISRSHSLVSQNDLIRRYQEIPSRHIPELIDTLFNEEHRVRCATNLLERFHLTSQVDPRTIRFLWVYSGASIAYQSLHIQGFVNGERPDINDTTDLLHVTSASEAELFITSDADQFRLAEACLPPETKVELFRTWVERIV